MKAIYNAILLQAVSSIKETTTISSSTNTIHIYLGQSQLLCTSMNNENYQIHLLLLVPPSTMRTIISFITNTIHVYLGLSLLLIPPLHQQ